jgi:hypothetical protein
VPEAGFATRHTRPPGPLGQHRHTQLASSPGRPGPLTLALMVGSADGRLQAAAHVAHAMCEREVRQRPEISYGNPSCRRVSQTHGVSRITHGGSFVWSMYDYTWWQLCSV